MSEPVSYETLNALVDGELDGAERERALAAIDADAALKRGVCELRLAKEQLRHAYDRLPTPPRRRRTGAAAGWRLPLAAAALLALGSGIGWLAHGWHDDDTTAVAALEAERQVGDPRHILIHLSRSEPQHLRAALDRIEGLLAAAEGDARALSVELVANSGGLDLLRADTSPEAARLAALQAKHANLALVACGQTAERLRERGVAVRLLPGTRIATSALDEIVARMQQGWTYLRI